MEFPKRIEGLGFKSLLAGLGFRVNGKPLTPLYI